MLSSLIKTSLLLKVASPSPATAVQGAFEMDAEYYLKNLLNINNNNITTATRTRALFPSPRKLDKEFAKKIVEIVKTSIAKYSQKTIDEINLFVENKLPERLVYFKKFAPIANENLSDQYYFDIIIYLQYVFAQKFIINSSDRVKLRDEIGSLILKLLLSSSDNNNYNIGSNGDNNSNNNDYNKIPMINLKKESANDDFIIAAELLPKVSIGIITILDKFMNVGLIERYVLDAENLEDVIYSRESFKEVCLC